jgi:O-succinylbenzoate synthase
MREPCIDRARTVSITSLPRFILSDDTSEADRYFDRDLTELFVLEVGTLRVPTGPGIGVEPDLALIDELATRRDVVRR